MQDFIRLSEEFILHQLVVKAPALELTDLISQLAKWPTLSKSLKLSEPLCPSIKLG